MPDGPDPPDSTPLDPATELEDARDILLMAVAVFNRWDRRLQSVAESLPEPRYADGSAEPLNLSAAVQSLLEALLFDEIRPAVELLRRAAAWIDDPATWTRPSGLN